MYKSSSISFFLMQEAADYFRLSPSLVRALSQVDIVTEDDHKHDITINNLNGIKTLNYTRMNSKQKDIKQNRRSNFKEEISSRPVDINQLEMNPSRSKQDEFISSRERRIFKENNYSSSPVASTNSLPSISSSPSVSPSLVCPHLSLDDILSVPPKENESPHTIGLCSRCRLSPPTDIHSPLSPIFKPSKDQPLTFYQETKEFRVSEKKIHGKKLIRRGYSDQGLGNSRRSSNEKKQLFPSNKSPVQGSIGDLNIDSRKPRDDSLDYSVDQAELRRMQLSPTLRHSVEFIRTHSSESGRVVKVYKNGLPYDKPLRICINKGEFNSLNHLLDHINSRQLIPYGARYLFHVDGQLVYSIHELKHGSSYIVSGSRQFDYKSSQVIKNTELASPRGSDRNLYRTNSNLPSTIQTKVVEEVSILPPVLRIKPLDTHDQQLDYSMKTEPKIEDPVHVAKPSLNIELNNEQEHNQSSSDNFRGPESLSDKSTQIQRDIEIPVKRSFTRKIAPISTYNQRPKESVKINGTIKKNPTVNRKYLQRRVSEESSDLKPTNLIRAKSDFNTLTPYRPKKNVTFSDTGRGSSPAIVDLHSTEKRPEQMIGRKTEKKNITTTQMADTSDIGIQVSDSIDGFLIDLPLPLPPSAKEKADGMRKIQGSKRYTNARGGLASRVAKPKRQIVTITERQLSNDELKQFNELNREDQSKEESNVLLSKDSSIQPERRPSDFGLYDESIIPCPPETSESNKILNEIQEHADEEPHRVSENGNQPERWQYPGGRAGSSTPTERPVSQNAANETMQARVTTPTPSLSTIGDNTSLSMSYETPFNWFQREDTTKPLPAPPELPDKERRLVKGKLCKGSNPPGSNFKLLWMNGFLINDHYPENSTSRLVERSGKKVNNAEPSDQLLPSNEPLSERPQYKPVDRFSNWICHSRTHDELIYPLGRIVILWCRWNDEQRYYHEHTSNISCLYITEPDIAISAQIGELKEKIAPCIHVWSIAKLETLLSIKDDQFLGKRIFSLKLRPNSQHSNTFGGSEIIVSAREDRRLWLFSCRISSDKNSGSSNQNAKGLQVTILKANKQITANQNPLLLSRLEATNSSFEAPSESKPSNQTSTNDSVAVTLGRKHCQVWLTDWRQRSISVLTSDDINVQFNEMISRATCWITWSSTELLLGDSNGNIYITSLSWSHLSNESINQTHKERLDSNKAKSQNLKFKIDKMHLLCSIGNISKPNGVNQSRFMYSITCLCKISSSLFVSGDSSSAIRFWRLNRKGDNDHTMCIQVSSISLPNDLGYICSILVSRYSRHHSIVEYYIVSTSNAILFGSVQLDLNKIETTQEVLAHSSLSVVYEGHETSIVNLVADYPDPKSRRTSQKTGYFFTCSLDFKVCKWHGRSLVWKSILPSACTSLAVHPTGFVLAVGSGDGTVYILDKISGLLISYFPLTPVCINCLAYSRDGSLLAAGCANGSIFILPVFEKGLKYKKVSLFQVSFYS